MEDSIKRLFPGIELSLGLAVVGRSVLHNLARAGLRHNQRREIGAGIGFVITNCNSLDEEKFAQVFTRAVAQIGTAREKPGPVLTLQSANASNWTTQAVPDSIS